MFVSISAPITYMQLADMHAIHYLHTSTVSPIEGIISAAPCPGRGQDKGKHSQCPS